MSDFLLRVSIPKFFICSVAAWILFSFYRHSRKRSRNTNGNGLTRVPVMMYLTIVVSSWSLQAFLMIFFYETTWIWTARVYLSTINNVFLLFAAAYLDYNPENKFFSLIRNFKQWRIIVLIIGIIIAILFSILNMISENETVVLVPETVFNFIVFIIWSYGLFRSFRRRGFISIAYAVQVLMLLLALFYYPFSDDPNYPIQYFFYEIRFSMILSIYALWVMIFICLAMSWVHEDWERIETLDNQLEFTGENNGRKWELIVTIPNYFSRTRIYLSAANYKLLREFSLRRISNKNDGWIRIESENEEQFYFHKQFSRICKEINIPISVLFENDRAGSYRLKVKPEAIRIQEPFLSKKHM